MGRSNRESEEIMICSIYCDRVDEYTCCYECKNYYNCKYKCTTECDSCINGNKNKAKVTIKVHGDENKEHVTVVCNDGKEKLFYFDGHNGTSYKDISSILDIVGVEYFVVNYR